MWIVRVGGIFQKSPASLEISANYNSIDSLGKLVVDSPLLSIDYVLTHMGVVPKIRLYGSLAR